MKMKILKFKRNEIDDYQRIKSCSNSVIVRMLLIAISLMITTALMWLNIVGIIKISSDNDLRSFMLANFIYIAFMFFIYPIIGIWNTAKSFVLIYKSNWKYKKYIVLNGFYLCTYVFSIVIIFSIPHILRIKI